MPSYYESSRTAINYIDYVQSPTDCRPHWHQAVEILVALESDVSVLLNGKERILHAGEICVADCYDVHSFHSHGKDVVVVIIPPEYLADYLKAKGKKHLATPYITDPEICKEIFTALQALHSAPRSQLLLRGYANVAMGLICQTCGLEEFADADIDLMQSVLNYLEENYNGDVTLSALAEHFGYSKYYFSRMFHRFFQINLTEYLSRLRIQRFLAYMQTHKEAQLTATAFDCGFRSLQTFFRCFKNYYGVSPKKYLMNR